MPARMSEVEIVEAHSRRDHARLAALYRAAAEARLAQGAEGAAAFFFTQAYVLALDAGDEAAATALHARLVALGRDA